MSRREYVHGIPYETIILLHYVLGRFLLILKKLIPTGWAYMSAQDGWLLGNKLRVHPASPRPMTIPFSGRM